MVYYDEHSEHVFESDKWLEDEEGKRRAENPDEYDPDIEKWLRAKIKRIVNSSNPKVKRLLDSRGGTIKMSRGGIRFEAVIHYLFVKQGYHKVYVMLDAGEGSRSFGIDSFEIVDASNVVDVNEIRIKARVDANRSLVKLMLVWGIILAIIIYFWWISRS